MALFKNKTATPLVAQLDTKASDLAVTAESKRQSADALVARAGVLHSEAFDHDNQATALAKAKTILDEAGVTL